VSFGFGPLFSCFFGLLCNYFPRSGRVCVKNATFARILFNLKQSDEARFAKKTLFL